MRPYRLEMGTKLANDHGKDLYAFWGDEISEQIVSDVDSSETAGRFVVNLASQV